MPLAILALQQGLGRLLRHRQDRGVLAILDPRLRTMGYGRRFLASLPPAPVTQRSRRRSPASSTVRRPIARSRTRAATTCVRPILKWAGGKRQLLPALRRFYPARFDRYVEPFLGSGAVFLDCHNRGLLEGRAVRLSDINADVIGCYRMVRDAVDDVIESCARSTRATARTARGTSTRCATSASIAIAARLHARRGRRRRTTRRRSRRC